MKGEDTQPGVPVDADHGLEQAMGRMLQVGVTVAALVVFVGGVLYLAQPEGARPDYTHFHPEPAGFHSISGIWRDALHLDPRGIIELGMLLLIATPIGRVVFGVVGFARLRDRLYTAVSALVLAILLFSFFTQH